MELPNIDYHNRDNILGQFLVIQRALDKAVELISLTNYDTTSNLKKEKKAMLETLRTYSKEYLRMYNHLEKNKL